MKFIIGRGWKCDGGEREEGGFLAVVFAVVDSISNCAGNSAAECRIADDSRPQVALLQCFCPVMTAMFSFSLPDERLSAAGFIGSAIILICVAAETLMKDEYFSNVVI